VVCGDAGPASVHSLPGMKGEFTSLKEKIEKIPAGGNGLRHSDIAPQFPDPGLFL